MLIRKGLNKDTEKCLKILKLDSEKYWETKDFQNLVRHDDVIFLIAEENKKIVGYIDGFVVPTKRTEVVIHETRVHKNERSKGIGTELVNAFCRVAFEKGAKIVLAEVAPKHLKFYRDACKFKETNNWIEVAREKKYFSFKS